MRRKVMRRLGEERGSGTVVGVLLVLILAMLVAFVVDVSGQVRTKQHAQASAVQAARAGGQAVQAQGAMDGSGAVVDLQAAVVAAQDALAAQGVTGTVRIEGDSTLVVDVEDQYDTKMLSAVGVGSISAKGHAESRLVRVVEGDES